MGLELLLMVNDPWKTIMTTDSPNGGPFIKYPQVITWLMSMKAREATFAECHKWAYDKSSLGAVDREMTLYEIAIVTRANPARTVGLTHRKGHLSAGADGDVTIYDFDPTKLNADDHTRILKGLQNAAYTIKDGGIVAQNGQIISVPQGRTFFTEAHTDDSLEKEMLKDVTAWFKNYTLGFANYKVPDKYLRNPAPVQVNNSPEAAVGM
jgi:formylmethanofuran dehydrogenase subunit A